MNTATTLPPDHLSDELKAQLVVLPAAAVPPPLTRQPVHTVYGGAHLFSAGVVRKLGDTALRAIDDYAPNVQALATALDLPGAETLPEDLDDRALTRSLSADRDALRLTAPAAYLAHMVYQRVRDKLTREPVEDLRIDFEDGYGYRSDAEEDGHAVAAASELARAQRDRLLPYACGIRIKPLSVELAPRALRTLDLFLTTLQRQGATLPENFVVALPKVHSPAQVALLSRLCEALEERLRWPAGALRVELMIETPQAVLGPHGAAAAPTLVAAARGRCVAVHVGAYDYTAALDITAGDQTLDHPACDFLRQVLQVSLAGSGVRLCDGATTLLPVGPHRAPRAAEGQLSSEQREDNRSAVWSGWQLHTAQVRRALRQGYYQGWDLHPAQLVARYGAVYSFFLEGYQSAATRLARFIDQAAQATRVGMCFDDAATGQGLLNYFLRGLACGALNEAEITAAGLTLDELRLRSFAHIVERRR